MKKITKVLAALLSAIVLMSSMSVMSGAISSKSTAKELLDYYENCIITTSAKEDVIKAKNVYKSKSVADYSTLKGDDLEATKTENEEWELFDGKWYESEYQYYFFCDAYEEYYYEGRSEYIDWFSIKRDIREFDLKFKSAKYAKDDEGVVTLTFVYLETDELAEYDCTWTYTIKINKNGYLKSYQLKSVSNEVFYSIEENPYKVKNESYDTYTFIYNKVDAESIELPEGTIVLDKDGEYLLEATIKPDNATFKDFYIDDEDSNLDVVDWYYGDNDEIILYAVGPGKTTLDVCAYSGDVITTVEVVVEYGFLETIIYHIQNFFYEIEMFFLDLFFGFQDGYYEEW